MPVSGLLEGFENTFEFNSAGPRLPRGRQVVSECDRRMTGVHVGEVAEFPIGEDAVDGSGEPSRAERIEALRRRISAVPAKGEASAPAPAHSPVERLLPVPEPLTELLPRGGLVRGTVVSVSGVGIITAGPGGDGDRGGWARCRHRPAKARVARGSEMGARLSRVAVSPRPGTRPGGGCGGTARRAGPGGTRPGRMSVPPSRARVVAAVCGAKGRSWWSPTGTGTARRCVSRLR